MIKNTLLLLFYILFLNKICAQVFMNFGDLEIHNNGEMGFFSSVINNGTFNNTNGLAGFYGEFKNSISGTNSPLFHDLEINNDQGIVLQIPITVSNNTNFVFGDIITTKTINTSYLEFASTSFYNGETNFSKVNGYLSISNVQRFLFPIGDEVNLRPLSIDTEDPNASFKSAYLYENGTINFSNVLENKAELISISNQEYWILEGNTSTIITIGWNQRSGLQNIAKEQANLTVVGFEKELKKWVNLGAAERTGNLEEGFISSTAFIPDHYNAITFGVLKNKTSVSHKGYHYLVTPNGDGNNDFLFIPELKDFESNRLMIFDRNGLKVFEQENYTNEFNGFASENIPAISRTKGLPEGIYYYLIKAGPDNLTIQGFLFLDR